MKTSNKANFLNAGLIVACLGVALSCSTFKNLTGGSNESIPNAILSAGQKLSGHYEHGSPSEIYTFDENGTYTHEDAYEDAKSKVKNKESGTYRVEGKEIIFQANGKSVSKDIRVLKVDVDKTSPQKIDLNLTTFELVTAEKLASRKKDSSDSTSTTSTADSVPAEYAKFAPAQVGTSAKQKAFTYKPSNRDSLTGTDVGAARFVYSNNSYFDVIKYPTAEAAQAEVKKRVSLAVDTAEYDKKVKLPKCDPNKETDYDTPFELIKTLPVKTGGDAYVLHAGKYWDADCKVDDNVRGEYVFWSDGNYFFLINSMGKDIYTSAFGKAEAFFDDYQNAQGN